MFSKRRYRLIDIAREIDRDKSTIIRWEDLGLIAKAKRDSRGWRYYSDGEVKEIVRRVRETDYFRNGSSPEDNGRLKPQRMVYIGVFIGVLFMLSQLFMVGNYVYADEATAEMYTTVTAGTLSIVSASSSNSFTGVSVSFTAQTATAPDLGAINVQDARGSGAGWSLTLGATDWNELNDSAPGGQHNQLDYDGTGSDGDLGKMCIIVASGAIESAAGQDTTSITKGGLTCFSAGVTSLSIYTAAASYGKGNYWITDFDLEQYIPSNPTAQSLTTTLTITLS